jgi:hypothetical protein
MSLVPYLDLLSWPLIEKKTRLYQAKVSAEKLQAPVKFV